MILVSVGTVSYPFPRLVKAAIALPIREEMVIQTGDYYPGRVPDHIKLRRFVPFHEMIGLYRKSRRVVSAAGEGSIMLMLQYCRNKPVLFPRLKQYREHVDDQQVEVACAVERAKLATVVTTAEELGEILRTPVQKNRYGVEGGNLDRLKRILNISIQNLI